jgi:Right handed beta helix region
MIKTKTLVVKTWKSGWLFIFLLLFVGLSVVQAADVNVRTVSGIEPGSTVYPSQDLQDVVNAASAGDTIIFDCVKDANGTILWYRIDGTIEINKPLTIKGPDDLTCRPVIGQIQDKKSMFKVLSSGVTFQNIYVRGTGSGIISGPDHFAGIHAAGTKSAQLNNIKVLDCTVREWGYAAILFEYVRDTSMANSRIRKNNIRYIGYAGVLLRSSENVQVDNNRIDTVLCNYGDQGYGIQATSQLKSDLRSKNILINWNTVSNVSLWEGIDTHAGIGILIKYNYVYGCPKGIVVTYKGFGNIGVAAEGCHIIGNTVRGDNIKKGYIQGINVSGIKMNGTYYYAKDCTIRYNVVSEFGGEKNLEGNIRVHTTKNLRITDNQVYDANPIGIVLINNNENILIDLNCLDTKSNTNMIWGIRVRDRNNSGTVRNDNTYYGFAFDGAALRVDYPNDNPDLDLEYPLIYSTLPNCEKE